MNGQVPSPPGHKMGAMEWDRKTWYPQVIVSSTEFGDYSIRDENWRGTEDPPTTHTVYFGGHPFCTTHNGEADAIARVEEHHRLMLRRQAWKRYMDETDPPLGFRPSAEPK
jgi:hypothetical protein